MLNTPLPDYLYWLTDKMEGLLRPASFLRKDATKVSPRGGTRAWGLPDRPRDAAWAKSPDYARSWDQSPYDGDSFWLQLNLEEIPAAVRKPEWPTVGVVWVFINLQDHWEATVYFDARSAAAIPWMDPMDAKPPAACTWLDGVTAPDCTEETFPEVYYANDCAQDLANWACDNYACRAPSDLQVGGWHWPCQGSFDDRNKTFVCALSRQPFGDHGEIALHYSPEHGFFAFVETH